MKYNSCENRVLVWLGPLAAFWSYMAKIMVLPMTLSFPLPSAKKTKWYERQKPNPVRYVLIDSQDIPHFADFKGIPYTLQIPPESGDSGNQQ